MMILSELFDIRNGIPTTGLNIYDSPAEGRIPFLRPANRQERTISGWVQRSDIAEANVYEKGSLFVSTNGEGSHSYAYVSSFEFSCNSDVAVLIPKMEMTLAEKIYFSRCISMNRYKFSYGRKPKGKRLKSLILPDIVPSWVSEPIDQDYFSMLRNFMGVGNEIVTSKGKSKNTEAFLPLSQIFDVRYGHSLELNRLELLSREDGGIPFISRKMGDNGIADYVAPIEGVIPASPGDLTCALSGNGVLSTFIQSEAFYTGYHVACLTPKIELSQEQCMYYCSCINLNKFRYSYGRQANRTLKNIILPTPDSIPEWVENSFSRVINKILQSNDSSIR
jgi:hypothetical protein